ncbi:hypothetical protein KM043_012463 [Ampulex compressa]|nr:hypothetical protein KM043_012463 [Ampulex compressa]
MTYVEEARDCNFDVLNTVHFWSHSPSSKEQYRDSNYRGYEEMVRKQPPTESRGKRGKKGRRKGRTERFLRVDKVKALSVDTRRPIRLAVGKIDASIKPCIPWLFPGSPVTRIKHGPAAGSIIGKLFEASGRCKKRRDSGRKSSWKGLPERSFLPNPGRYAGVFLTAKLFEFLKAEGRFRRARSRGREEDGRRCNGAGGRGRRKKRAERS